MILTHKIMNDLDTAYKEWKACWFWQKRKKSLCYEHLVNTIRCASQQVEFGKDVNNSNIDLLAKLRDIEHKLGLV